MNKLYKPRRSVMAEINVVPYIDVMLVLLVIFIITTPLLTQGVKINLPKAKAKSVLEQNQIPIVVSVDSQGQYYLNISTHPQKPIAPQQLAIRIAAQLAFDKQQHLNRPVLIKGDKNVDYDKVVHAMVLLQNAGVTHIGLITNPVTFTHSKQIS